MEQLVLLDVIDESLTDPRVLVWPGDPNHPMPTLNQAYAEGRSRGLSWPGDREGWRHVPGGPWEHRGLPEGHPLVRQARHSQLVRSAWLRGWHAGFREQLGGRMPAWYR